MVQDASKVEEVAAQVDFIFCAVNMPKDEIKALEEAYAKAECPVVSNNSANRFTPDVPMVVPRSTPTILRSSPHSASVWAQARLHRRQVQLQPAELCARAAPADEGIWCEQGSGVHLSGNFRCRQDL